MRRIHLSDHLARIEGLCTHGGHYDGVVAAVMRVEYILRDRRIRAHAKDLTYEEFLETDYWQDLSAWMKWSKNYTCEACGVQPTPIGSGLNVHHKTYEHRGNESPDHLDDLQVLCRKCHMIAHGKFAESAGAQ